MLKVIVAIATFASIFSANAQNAIQPTNSCHLKCDKDYIYCVELRRHDKVELGEKASAQECSQRKTYCDTQCELKGSSN